jgi:hypothetical protein
MFHIIGPTSSNVSAVLFTPWPIVIIHITMCLRIKINLELYFIKISRAVLLLLRNGKKKVQGKKLVWGIVYV